MNKPILTVNNVSKLLKKEKLEIPILKDITFSVNESEFVSIMGPSGCGKSTLLYLLGGLDNPTSGTIHFNNEDLHVLKDKQISKLRRAEIGFIFQFYNLIPSLNVEENILLPVLMDGKNAKEYKGTLDELLHIVGLEDRRRYMPNELSGGQQQRVAIARALINSPKLLLADEPIGNLDSQSGTGVMELFKRINQEKNISIIQVTHSQDAAFYGNRVIRLLDGEIESEQWIEKNNITHEKISG
ncbi:ABC transporter ATP-binding protein [Lysinibacillus xylanilyticus]|uniref:ABC transporter ATP-binding protein n=1 Tax=Lysinibacillus xylanilyticus TaxID=582475 RepID=UPI0036DC96DD